MKIKFSTISISLLLAGLLVYGFISLNSDDPYTDYAPGVETSITTSNGIEADTITPAGWPFPVVWNFYYGNIVNINGGTVGACFYSGKYFFNRWNSAICYFLAPSGPNGGPGGTPTSAPYVGAIRDMTVSSATSPRGYYIWGGAASTTLYKFGANAQTLGTFVAPGASFRAIAYDPVRDAFWNSNFGANIFCHDTSGTLITSYANTWTAKYGMAYDDKSTPGQKFLWVWEQVPANTLHKLNITTLPPVVAGNYTFTSGANIAGGAEAYPSPDGTQFWLVLNYQNFANVAYKLADLGPAVFCDDFESYTVGQRLACQDSINWTTWSNDPCNTTEDPLISSAQAFSPTKSVVIVQNNDLVKPLGNDTTGIHDITFKFYVPTGKAGYFNTLALFAPPYSWAMQCYFDIAATGNNGRLFAGQSAAFPFAYTHNAWQTVNLVVNLDIDSARFSINGNVIRTWRWTAGGFGAGGPKVLAANNFFGATANDQMYMDNYCHDPDASWLTGVTQNGNTVPTEYALSQNYPNPFNPSTKINFAIPTTGLVTMKIYDVLGKEVATLVNETKVAGTYSVNFDGTNLSSGVYFYRVEANDFVAVKRMMLIK